MSFEVHFMEELSIFIYNFSPRIPDPSWIGHDSNFETQDPSRKRIHMEPI
jgi:hypothetical protein